MALMSDVDLPLAHLREQIASAVDVVVHMARLPGGRRVGFHVASVDGMHEGRPVVNEVFTFRAREGPDGVYAATGVVPKVVSMLRARGEEVPARLFRPGPDHFDEPMEAAP
jgi:pilus assembly protein CpaF